jgi:hypothetical protein
MAGGGEYFHETFVRHHSNLTKYFFFLRANGAERRSWRKPGARVLILPGYLHPGKRKH